MGTMARVLDGQLCETDVGAARRTECHVHSNHSHVSGTEAGDRVVYCARLMTSASELSPQRRRRFELPFGRADMATSPAAEECQTQHPM